MSRYSPLTPPSHRNASYRKSQLLRGYVSLLQTTPCILVFQHNNLKATEWVGVRRELGREMRRVDAAEGRDGMGEGGSDREALAGSIKLSIIQTNIFEPAVRIAEFYRPGTETLHEAATGTGIKSEATDPTLTHALSTSAYNATRSTPRSELSHLLSGPIALLTFPEVSPAHVAAALGVLSPDKKVFKAPRKAVAPGLYEVGVQEGLRKVMLLGGRVEGRVFGEEGVRGVGSLGNLEGIRGQLVGLLQGGAAGLVGVLGGQAMGLWGALEARRMDMEGPVAVDGAGLEEKKEV
jgi:large subunit ribosomal protein L10